MQIAVESVRKTFQSIRVRVPCNSLLIRLANMLVDSRDSS